MSRSTAGRRAARHGFAAFDDFYREMHGERWEALRRALLAPTCQAELSAPVLGPYFLDEASLIAAQTLSVQPGHRVLDMCAAPGGKSLVLAVALGGEGELVSNERSASRRAHLARVLDEQLPAKHRSTVRVTGLDASVIGLKQPACYDRVLLDAPCSSERHVIASAKHLNAWSPARTRHLSIQAYAMLSSALMACRAGGEILYVTCSISHFENDGVLAKLEKRHGATVEFLDECAPYAEKTVYGSQILPDRAGGRGPAYFALIRKHV